MCRALARGLRVSRRGLPRRRHGLRRALRAHGIEARWTTLRDRVCALDARAADLLERARECDPADRVEALGEQVAETVSVVLGAAKASLMVLSRDGRELEVAAATGRDVAPEEMDPVAPGEGVAGLAISEGSPFVVDDMESDERFAGRRSGDRYASKSLVVTPIAGGGRPLGVLCATDREDGAPFGVEDLALLRILALHVGQILGERPSGKALARISCPTCHRVEKVSPTRTVLLEATLETCSACHDADEVVHLEAYHVEVQGALMCGYHAARAVQKELSEENGFAEYTRWWQESFEFNSDEYLRVAQGYALSPTYSDDELDYLFSLTEDKVLKGTYSQYLSPKLMWDAILRHQDRIQKERPEIYAKIQKNRELSFKRE